jgi:alpha-beta hydrolase superfamily lysophospholipase
MYIQPESSPKAKLIFVHNFNDHIDRYWELFPSLASRGVAVYAFDQRGWGKSYITPSTKCHMFSNTSRLAVSMNPVSVVVEVQ